MSTQQLHTPTPWRVFDLTEYTYGNMSARYPGIDQKGDGYSIVVHGFEHELMGVRGRTIEESAANAAFIVRACNAHYEMLEALKAYDYVLVCKNMSGKNSSQYMVACNHFNKLRKAAIAKAEKEAAK